MLSVFRIFWHAEGTRPWVVLMCLVLAGVSEAVSLAALLPILTQIGGGLGPNSSPSNSYITDAFIFLGIEPDIGTLIIFVTGAMVVKSLLTMLAIGYAGYSVSIVATRMRTRLLNAMFKVNWAYFTSHRSGRITNAISNDATRCGDAYYISARLVAFALQAGVYITVSFLISPGLAGAGVVVGIALLLGMSSFVQMGRKAGNKQTDHTSYLVTLVSDALNNMKAMKAMNRTVWFEQFFIGRIRLLRKALFKKTSSVVALLYGQDALKALAAGAGVYVAAIYWKVPLPEMVIIGVIFMQVISIISKVQGFLQQAATLESAYWRTEELTSNLIAHEEVDAGNLVPSLDKHCTFENVSFDYGGVEIIKNASFKITAGGITVLQGPSGAGKTTLIDLLLGLHRPSNGEIFVDDIPLGDISLKSWRAMSGYVPQELALLHGSIRDNITFGDESIDDDNVLEALKLAGGAGFVGKMPNGLDTIAGEMGAKLSGGQRQRIALARALVGNPKLLVLDEVTSALDPEIEIEICANVQKLAGRYTIIAITHRPAWTKIANNLYLVKNGQVQKVDV